MNAIIQQDLGLYLGDETKIMAMGSKGISNSRYRYSIHYSNLESNNNEWKQSEIFNAKVILKHTKIDTLFDSGSQVNFFSEAIVKNMGLKTAHHIKPCPIGLGE